MARGVMDTLRTTSGATLKRCLVSASAESVDKLVTSLKFCVSTNVGLGFYGLFKTFRQALSKQPTFKPHMSCNLVKSMSVCIGDACIQRFVRNANNDLVEDDSLELLFNRELFAANFLKRTQVEPTDFKKRKCDGAMTDNTNPDKKCKNEKK